MYQRWFQWEGAMGEHWGHMPDEIFVEELLVKGILQVVVGCDWCPARVGLDFIAISLYCRWFKWKTARTKLRIKAVGKAALTRSQPISFYHLEGLKVGKPWLDEDLPRACSWSLERAVITYRWATRKAHSALQHIGNRNRGFIKPKKESTTERREERSQKLSTVTFKTGRSPGRRRTFSPTGFRSGCMNPWPPWPSAGGRSPLRSLPSALPWGEVSRNHTPVPESLPNSGNNTFGAVRRKKYHLQIRI